MNKKHKMQNLMGGKERYIKPSIKTHKLMCENTILAASPNPPKTSGPSLEQFDEGDTW